MTQRTALVTPRRTDNPGGRGGVRRGRASTRRWWPQYVAISPYFVLFAGFSLFPVFFSAYLAFHHWNGLGAVTWAGLAQFGYVFHDGDFGEAIVNTLIIWVLSTVPMLFFSLVIASLVNAVRRFRTLYQVILFLPSVTSIVAVAIFFHQIFSNSYGLVNDVLQGLGLPVVEWLNGWWTIKIVISVLLTWQWVGYNAILYVAGMQAIPSDVYEAAKIDGAGPVRTFASITVPLLRPIILFTVIISTINGLQTFTEPQVLFSNNVSGQANPGGPQGAGMTMVLYFYQQAFVNNNYGYGAALAYVIFLIVAVFAIVNWRLVARSER